MRAMQGEARGDAGAGCPHGCVWAFLSARWAAGLLAALAVLAPPEVRADSVSGYQEYYVPLREDEVWLAFDDLEAGTNEPVASNGMHAVISVVSASQGATVYYDHWEDGYDFNPTNPAATADVITNMTPNQLVVFESSNIPVAPRGTALYYDGGDRIYVAGGQVTVNRATWTDTPVASTLYAYAFEIYPTRAYMTNYIVIAGEGLGINDFSRSYVFAMSSEDDNTITIEEPGGTTNSAAVAKGATLNLLRANAYTVVRSTKPMQVNLMSGVYDANYHTRGFTMTPSPLWGNEYWAPVGTISSTKTAYADAYFYNPGTNNMTLYWDDRAGSGSFTVTNGTTRSFRNGTGRYIATNSSLHVRADRTFWGVVSEDANSNAWEWTYSLQPVVNLNDDYTVGWAPSSLDKTASGNPVWAAAVADNTTVFADYSPVDGTADVIRVLNRYDVLRIDDPDHDNSAMHVWATQPIALAWGEDPDTNTGGANYLDLGYTLLPYQESFADLVLSTAKSADPVVLPVGSNQVTKFTVTIQSYDYPVDSVYLEDVMPPGFKYESNTTYIVQASGTTNAPSPSTEPAVTNRTLYWGPSQLGSLGSNQSIQVWFDARTTNYFSVTNIAWNAISAVGTRYVGTAPNISTQTFRATANAYNIFGDLQLTKSSTVPSGHYPAEAGDTITYTMVVSNPANSTVNHTNVSLTDWVPYGTVYTSNSTTVIVSNPAYTNVAYGSYYVADNFSAQAYNNQDGTANWGADWYESETTQDPAAGNIRVSTSGDDCYVSKGEENIYRVADLSGATNAVFSADVYEEATLESTDYAYVEVSSNGTAWALVAGFTNDFGSFALSTNITAFASANTYIRFRTSGYTDGTRDERFRFDNVRIDYQILATNTYAASATTNTAANPAYLASGVTLAPGGSIRAVFSVTVEDPIPTNLPVVVNTAYAGSHLIQGLQASATNLLEEPTLIYIDSMSAFERDGQVVVRWSVWQQLGSVGFWLERWDPAAGRWVCLNEEMIPAVLFGTGGESYEVVDAGARTGGAYRYRIVELDNTNRRIVYNPVELTVDGAAIDFAEWCRTQFVMKEIAILADGRVRLVWNSLPDTTYRIEAAGKPEGPFEPVATGVPSGGTQTEKTIDGGAAARFFRVLIE